VWLTLFFAERVSRLLAERVIMQLNLGFIAEEDANETKLSPSWESLDETARQLAAARLARLIARMLVGARRDGEAHDD
jgi:hypothetical protein